MGALKQRGQVKTMCRKGLHAKAGPGRCLECRRASHARYKRSEKGRAAHARTQGRYARSVKGWMKRALYDSSEEGRASTALRQARYRRTEKGRASAARGSGSRSGRSARSSRNFWFKQAGIDPESIG